MRFQFKRSDASAEAGFRRIASETLDESLALLRDREQNHDLTTAQIVHRMRRSCKAMRGLLRLVRPVFPAYESENAVFRDVAASLSAARDSTVLVEALDSLIAQADRRRREHGALEPGDIAAIRAELAKPAEDPASIETQLEQAAQVLLAARVRAAGWSLVAHGDAPLAPGLHKSYRAARRGMKALAGSGDPQLSHEWRKQVKYHWQHMRLLRSLAPHLARDRVRAAGRLGDMMGEQHDFDLLAHMLEDDRMAGETAKRIALLAGRRAARLARRSAKLGAQLFDQKPSVYMKAWDDVWARWPRL